MVPPTSEGKRRISGITLDVFVALDVLCSTTFVQNSTGASGPCCGRREIGREIGEGPLPESGQA